MTLSTTRAAAAAEAIAIAAEAISLADLDGDGAAALKAAVGARLVAITHFDAKGRPQGRAGDLGELAPQLYFPHFAGDDPIIDVVAHENSAIMSSDRWLSRRDFENTGVYSDYYRPREIDRVLCTRLATPRYFTHDPEGRVRPAGELALVAFFRARSEPAFTPSDEHLLGRLRPSLEAVARRDRRAQARQRTEAALEALVELCERQPRMVMDASGTLVWMSRRARAMLAPVEGRPRLDAVLAAGRRLATGACPAEPLEGRRAELRFGRPGSLASVSIHVVRAASGESFLVAEIDGPQPPPLAERFGLTSTEREILEALALGLSNEEIAGRRRISLATVKTHVHRILGKLGVSSRLQAALLLIDD